LVSEEHKILRVKLDNDLIESVNDEVVIEYRLVLFINKNLHVIFLCSPYEIKELIIGHLFSEGIVERLDEITRLEIGRGTVHVTLDKNIIVSHRKTKIIQSSCGGEYPIIPDSLLMENRINNDTGFNINPKTIIKSVKELNNLAHIFRRTGGTHASAISNEKGILLKFSEDIGRHNAIDKVIGKAVLDSIEFSKTFLASTGRLTSEMVTKGVIMRIPVIVSISAPTDRGIKIAEKAGLTLVGFTRGRRFNIYSNPERIVTNKV